LPISLTLFLYKLCIIKIDFIQEKIMEPFKQLNKREKFSNFCQYLFIALLPIIGLISISTYAFVYLKNDFDFVSKEIDGLQVIMQVHESVFKFQKLRGLSSIVNCGCEKKDMQVSDAIRSLKTELSQDLQELQKLIESKQSSQLQGQLLSYIKTLDPQNDPTDFKSVTALIYELLHFSSKIAYECNLKLEPELETYVMVDNVVSLLPKIIEYNGQIRAASSSIANKSLTQSQEEHIRMQISKIEEKLDALRFNYSMLSSYNVYTELEKNYQTMLDAQKEIIHIVEKELLDKQSIEIEGLNIYAMISKNINLIIELQRSNAECLKQELIKRYYFQKKLLNILFVITAFSLLFTLYVYYYFYQTNKRFIDTIEKLSITDAMTHLYNRRYFDLIIEQQLKLLSRHKESFAFMLLDIDFFKQYNDHYGHQAGDEALKKVAKCLSQSLRRESDMAFRLGGEEFGVVAVDVDETQALALANKIKELIANEQIAHEKSSVNPYLTISIGVIVVSHETPWDVNEVYRSADKALYEAKEQGRDRISLFHTVR
jgi:diguanylate cyclase (GGDEF)-like protein